MKFREPVLNRNLRRHSMLALSLCLLVMISASGCTYTVHPVLTEDDLIDHPDLTGRWRPSMDRPFSRTDIVHLEGHGNPRRYTLSVSGPKIPEADTNIQYELWIGQIGNRQYGQVRRLAGDGPPRQPLTHGIPVFAFFQLEVERDEIRIFYLDEQKFAQWLRANGYPHLVQRPSESDFPEFTILTSSTPELQKLIELHADQFFHTEPTVLERVDRNR